MQLYENEETLISKSDVEIDADRIQNDFFRKSDILIQKWKQQSSR